LFYIKKCIKINKNYKALVHQLLRSWCDPQAKASIMLSLSVYDSTQTEAAMIIAASELKGN
jgi:hypothetical protein